MELENLKKSVDGVAVAFEEFKKTNDARLKAIEEKKGTGEIESKLNKIEADIEAKTKTIEQIHANMNKFSPQGEEKTDNKQVGKKAFASYLRNGVLSTEEVKELSKAFPEEMKALVTNSNPNGGYLVRPYVEMEIQKLINETSPMRKLASQISISTDSYEQNYKTGNPSSGWVGETQSRSGTNNSSFNKISIPVHELYAMPEASQKMLDDAMIDIEAWHQEQVVEELAIKEENAFIAGDGILKPKGILSYAAGTGFNQLEQINSGASGDLTNPDKLIDMQSALKEVFQANASWLCTRAFLGKIRKLKDGDDRYLFSIDPQAGLNGAMPFMLLGKPIHIAADMQEAASNSLSLAYGDFKKGYKIVDRFGIRVVRDAFTSKPNVLFYTTKRVGGGVVHFEAIKLLKLAV